MLLNCILFCGLGKDACRRASVCLAQGDADEFLDDNLKPNTLVEAAKKGGNLEVHLRMQVRSILNVRAHATSCSALCAARESCKHHKSQHPGPRNLLLQL